MTAPDVETKQEHLLRDLRERVKELDCLYGIARSAAAKESLDEVARDTVSLVPPGWQYPEITRCKVRIGEKEYVAEPFDETPWKQTSDIVAGGEGCGRVEVYYLEERPTVDEGPFLAQERSLIDGIARVLGQAVERRRAEEALRESEERWRSLVANAPNTIMTADRDGTILFVNRLVEGLTEEGTLGKKLYDFIPPAYHPIARETLERVFRSGEAGGYETIGPGPAGRVSWYKTRIGPVMRGEQVVAATLIATDITERMEVEEKLRASEKSLKRAQRVGHVGSWDLDVVTGSLYWSDEVYRIYGFEPQEFVPTYEKFLTILHPDDHERTQKQVDAALSGEAEYCIDFRFVRPDGKTGWIHCEGEVTRDEEGKPLRFFGTQADITEHKQAEEKLRESERRFRAIFEGATDGILLADPEGKRFVDGNGAICRMLGYTREELTRLGVADLPPEDRRAYVLGQFEKCAKGEISLAQDVPMKRKNGSVFYAEISSAPVEAAGQPCLMGIFRDVTERKRAEEELARLNKQLRETARQAGMAEIASNVLHNVGNVLNSVNISAQLAMGKLKDCKVDDLAKAVDLLKTHEADLAEFMATDPKGRRTLEFLEMLAEHLASERDAIIEELRSVARNIEHIKEIVSLQQSHARAYGAAERLVVAEVVEGAIKINQASMERHGIRVAREYAEVPPVVVEEHKLMQVLVNLVSNARYALIHSGRSDKLITVRISSAGLRRAEGTLAPQAGDDGVRIEVADNGVGIAEENLERIFTRGFTTRKDGHGFGLHDAAIAATEMGGKLTFHSDGPGKGAVFELEVPLQPPEYVR